MTALTDRSGGVTSDAAGPSETPSLAEDSWRRRMRGHPFWVSIGSFIAISLLHYSTFFSAGPAGPISHLLHLLAAKRFLFVLPVAGAAYAVGQTGGWISLAAAVLVMLPGAIWLAPAPDDALVETLVTALAGALVIWILGAQARARSDRQQALSRLQAISSVTTMLTRSLELQEVLDRTLAAVLSATGFEAGIIYVLDPESARLVPGSSSGVASELVPARQVPGDRDVMLTRLACGSEVIPVGDADTTSRLAPLASPLPREGPLVVLPLRSEGSLQGAIALGAACPRTISPEELDLITAIGNQTGVAIQHAQLHRDSERQLRVQLQLNEVAEQITTELDPDRVLPKVLEIAEELTGGDGGLIALFNPESELMHYPYVHNLPDQLAHVAVPTAIGLASEVMTSGRRIVIDDYRTYPRAIPEFVEAGVTRIAGVPVSSGDETFGTLAVVGLGEDSHFSESDTVLLQGIGRQAGIAIQNARLYARMRFYAREIVRAQEGERSRIARELHDETIQMLIVLRRRLEALQSLPEALPEAAASQLEALQELIGDTVRGVRRFVQDLRPPTLDHLGLVATLQALVDDLENVDGLAGQLHVSGTPRRLAADQELALFRIAQEAVSNVRRHSGADSVTVVAEFLEDGVRVAVEDNGRGFSAPTRMDDMVSAGRLGVIGMNERARNMGGSLDIRSSPGRGTSVAVWIPENAEAAWTNSPSR